VDPDPVGSGTFWPGRIPIRIAFTLQDPLSGFAHERILGNNQSLWFVSVSC
jgi:hypothetical protein